MSKGTVYLIPMPIGSNTAEDVMPSAVVQSTIALKFFIVENVKTTRRYLRKLDRTFPIDKSTFFELNKKTDKSELRSFLTPALNGENIGILSEAGCPGIADPGAEIVALCHEYGIEVHPYVGPSSILLALMASGFSGQEFTFHGYLPKERKERIFHLKKFEQDTRKRGVTHLFMDTPFRNMNVLEDLLNELSDVTLVSIASNITADDQKIKTMS